MSSFNKYLISFLIFFFLSFSLYNRINFYLKFRKLIWDNEYNTQCLCTDPNFEFAQIQHLYCHNANTKHYSKFLWFVTDGFASKFAYPSFSPYAEHSVLYELKVPGYKFSHAIYTSWLTGQESFNYQGKSIVGDQIMRSYNRQQQGCQNYLLSKNNVEFNNVRPVLRYEGVKWSLLVISGLLNDLFPFVNVHGVDESLKEKAIPYRSMMEEDQLEQVLSEVLSNNQSLLTHTGIFDKKNHHYASRFDREQFYAKMSEEAIPINNLLSRLKKFIDKNPQYLLILSSDHGVDVSVSGIDMLHGDGLNHNIGYMLFYNPTLPPSPDYTTIDVVDVAPTISSYLGIDFPIHTIGIPRNYWGGDINSELISLKHSLVQLHRSARFHNIETGLDDKFIIQLLKQSDVNKIQYHASYIKSLIFSGDLNFPYIEFPFSVFFLFLLFFIMFFNLIIYEPSLSTIFFYILLFFSTCVYVFFGDFRFAAKIFEPGYTFLYQYLLIFTITYILNSNKNNHSREVQIYLFGDILYIFLFPYISSIQFINKVIFIKLTTWVFFLFLSSIIFKTLFKYILVFSLLMICFFFTKENQFFFVHGFHILAFFILLILLISFLYFIITRQPFYLLIPFIFFHLFLYEGDLVLIFQLWLYFRCLILVGLPSNKSNETEENNNNKYLSSHLPLSRSEHTILFSSWIQRQINIIRTFYSKYFSFVVFPSNSYHCFLTPLSQFSLFIYISHLPFFHFTFLRKEIFDMNIIPAFGAQGLDWNTHPNISVFLMSYSKFGNLWIGIIFSGLALHSSLLFVWYNFVLYFFTSIGYYIAMYWYSIQHQPEEALTLLMNLFCCSFIYFYSFYNNHKIVISYLNKISTSSYIHYSSQRSFFYYLEYLNRYLVFRINHILISICNYSLFFRKFTSYNSFQKNKTLVL